MRSDKYLKQNGKKRRKGKFFKILLFLLLALFAYIIWFLFSGKNMLDQIKGEDIQTDKRLEQLNLKNKEPFSVLLLGVDEREGDVGRSDTIIVVTVNPKENNVKMLSIPRDTLVEIPDYGYDKVNAAYAYGGVPLAHKTIENFLDIPIDFYAKINMEGMEAMVDAVGGVTVDSPLAFTLDGYEFPEGKQDLNGKEALAFVRMRKEDPEGDYGRQKRQRQVIQAIVKKTVSVSSLVNFNRIFKAVGDNIETNLTSSELLTISTKYGSAAGTIEDLSLEGTSALEYIEAYGQEVYVIHTDPTSLANIQTTLKQHLEITN